MGPTGQELVARYRSNYAIPDDARVTERMVLAHWELEKQLTSEILASKPEDRWETVERCYTRLYDELGWLNRIVGGSDTAAASAHRFEKWRAAVGPPPRALYEIGSGKGELIALLARDGFTCRGTEITRERGERHLDVSAANLSWGRSDGVHLTRFERPCSYDVVISDQVIEHIHPDDLAAHMGGVHGILRPDGRYVLSTPHRFSGPHDISRVFEKDAPCGMHLREYTYRELVAALRLAGFGRVGLAFVPGPSAIFRRRLGAGYLGVMLLVEAMLALIPAHRLRRRTARMLGRLRLFSNGISLVAEKG